MKHRRAHLLAATVLAMVLCPVVSLGGPDTDVGFRGWGPRVGLSLDPDQFLFGAHLDFGTFARHVRFQPNLEMGFGDNVRLITVNADTAYRFSSQWDIWTPYLGGGIGANNMKVETGIGGESETELGIKLLGGIEKGLSNGDRFFIETGFSLNDVPDAKFVVGWTFYH